MIKLLKFSKITQVIILFAFFLPFFKDGCGQSAEEKAKIAQAKQDSVTIAHGLPIDTAAGKAINTDTTNHVMASLESVPDRTNITQSLSADNNFYKAILRPYDGYSGIGYIIDYAAATIAYGGTIFAFIFLLIALVMKLINNPFYSGTVFTFNLMAFLGLELTHAEEYYWGYWCCLVIIALVLLMDAILWINYRRKKKVQQ